MEDSKNSFDNNPILYLFGFMGISCFTCCAIISLFIGVGWLMSYDEWLFFESYNWINTAIPITLILWGLVPILVFILLYKRYRQNH